MGNESPHGFHFKDSPINIPEPFSGRSVSSDLFNDDDDRKPSAASIKPLPSSTTVESEKLSEQLCCGICLDLMVHPQTVVPCGHTYCGKCLESHVTEQQQQQQPECPECRAAMRSVVPARQLNGLMETLVTTMPAMFAKNDLEHYHLRLKTEQCAGFKEIESSRHRKRSRHHSRLAAAHAAAVASSNSSSNNHNDTVVMNPHDLARRRSRSRREPAEFFHTSSSEMDIHAFFQPGRQPPVTTTTTTSIATTRTLTATATRHHPSAAAAQAEAEALPSATLTAAERMAQAYAERIFGHFAEASSSTGRVQTAHRSRSNRNSSSVTQQQPQQQQAQPHLQQQGQTMEDAICID